MLLLISDSDLFNQGLMFQYSITVTALIQSKLFDIYDTVLIQIQIRLSAFL